MDPQGPRGRGRGRGRGQTPTSVGSSAAQPQQVGVGATGVGGGEPQRGSPPQPSSPIQRDQPAPIMTELKKGVAAMSVVSQAWLQNFNIKISSISFASQRDAPPVHVIQRPDVGKRGRPIPLRANVFEIEMQGNLVVHHYKVQVEHEFLKKLKR